jgi:DNA-binding response OmpR family regulator
MSDVDGARRSRRILWVEDDYYHLRGLVKPLVKAGFEIIPARSYVEAEKVLRESRDFCLVILDLIIPYSDDEVADPKTGPNDIKELWQNGVTLFKCLREEMGIDVPVLVLSVVSSREVVESLTASGAHVMRKGGVLPDELMTQVLELLRDFRGHTS